MSNGVDVRWRFRRSRVDPCLISGNPALTHPLMPPSAYYKKPEEGVQQADDENYEFLDPLGATAGDDDSDLVDLPLPLKSEDSNYVIRCERVLDNTLETRETDRSVIDVDLPNFAPWRLKRQQMLDFCSLTAENLSSACSPNPVPISRVNGPEKVRRRMEIMEDLSGLRKLSESSQQEFVTKNKEQREALVSCWHDNRRVEALKIVTEMTRTLSSTANASFYPEQWVLVTDSLDLFGKLVYDRLLQKANEERRGLSQSLLPSNFTSDDIPSETTEIAKNWFCKISDIKELIPRFYVETAMISSMRFLDSASIRVNLIRLATMTAKFSHTLQAAYGRAYLSKISMVVDPTDRAPHWRVLNDWMQSQMPHMPELTSLALEWIIQCVSYGASSINDIGPLWEYCRQESKRGFVSRAFLNGLNPNYIADHIVDVIVMLSYEGVSGFELAILADRLMLTDIPPDIRTHVLRSVWKLISRLTSTSEYLRSCVSWIRFTSRYFSTSELISITENVVKRASADPSLLTLLPVLVQYLRNMLEFLLADLHSLIKSESFISLLDILRDDPYASQCAKEILLCFSRIYAPFSMTDFVVAYQMIDHCTALCQSLKPDSLLDEVRSVCGLVCSVFDRFDLYSDLDRALSLLVAARSAIGDFPQVVMHIVNVINRCAVHCLAAVPPSSKRNVWLRACIANIFITIPSFDNAQDTFEHALQGAAVALAANSLPQADSLMKMCAEMLNEMPVTPAFTLSAASWLALLVSVPDSPSKHILYLFDVFVKILDRKHWEDKSQLAELLVKAMSYLWAVSQPKIDQPFTSVLANDTIYGQSRDFLDTIESHVDNLMKKLMNLIESEDSSQPAVSLLLLEFLSSRVSIEGNVASLVGNLLKKVVRSGSFSGRMDGVIADLLVLSEENSSVRGLLEKLKIV